MVYYNDNNPYCCKVLRARIADGSLPEGFVDERSITDVTADDLKPYRQIHLFAGIGGWPYAFQLAGWPCDRPVWTASCPCQSVSGAGKRLGEKDERHLWPELYRLIKEHHPDTIFGEQVASGDGPEWLDGICLDLEELGYAIGTANYPAAGLAAPIIRQRLWWVAESDGGYASTEWKQRSGEQRQQPQNGRDSQVGSALVSPSGTGLQKRVGNGRIQHQAKRASKRKATELPGPWCDQGLGGSSSGGRAGHQRREHVQLVANSSPWIDYEIVQCDERGAGKGWVSRRTKSGVFPLASRVPGRMAQLRAIGNSIVPQVAARFIKAYLETQDG